MRLLLIVFFLLSAFATQATEEIRRESIRGCIGTYGRPNWTTNGHADVQKLLGDLEDIRANTFHWAIHGYTNEWDEIKIFLPLAREKKIKVWITLMPPSESPP